MRLLIILTLSLMAATCGQKGPLFLPESEPTAPPADEAAALTLNARS